MNAANRARLDAWRERYHASGHSCDVCAHIQQRVRGVAWDRRHYGMLAVDAQGFLPVRTPAEHFAELGLRTEEVA